MFGFLWEVKIFLELAESVYLQENDGYCFLICQVRDSWLKSCVLFCTFLLKMDLHSFVLGNGGQ